MQYYIIPTLDSDVFLLTTSKFDCFNCCVYKGNFESVIDYFFRIL